jgi:hypothetical protein
VTHKSTPSSAIQLKIQWKTISTEEKLYIIHWLEKRECNVHKCHSIVMCDKNSSHIVNTPQKLTLNTARMMRVTFSLTESLRMFANIGIILDLKQNTIPHSTLQSITWPFTILKSGMANAYLWNSNNKYEISWLKAKC